MGRKQITGLLILTMFALMVVCIPKTLVVNANTAEPTESAADKIDVAIVFATGGRDDKSFNTMAERGMQRAVADGLITEPYDASAPEEITEYDGLLENYAASGKYELIVAIGFDQATALETVAEAHPNQKFVLIDMVVTNGSTRSVVYKAGEGSFLVGAMAGLKTMTGKLGFVGGMDIDLIRDFWSGYKAGALYVNDTVKVIEGFVGAWDDPTKAKSLAETMWADGADIIFAAAGLSGQGVLDSAADQTKGERFAIGVDADQDWYKEGYILCSMVKRVDLGVYNAIKDVYDGNWTASPSNPVPDIKEMGLKEFGVDISNMTYTRDYIKPEWITKVNVTIRDQIVDGNLTVPYKQFVAYAAAYGVTVKRTPGFGLLATVFGLALIPVLFKKKRK